MKFSTATSMFVLIFLVFGCGRPLHPDLGLTRIDAPATCTDGRINQLARDLTALLGHSDEETVRLAEAAVTGALALAFEYQALYSGKFNNFLILLGLRDRGLCCHWTRDLLDILSALKLKNFHLFWAVSEFETHQEHSSIVVTAAGQPFATGIVLDAWRNAGQLYWAQVAADTYVWQPHPEDDGSGMIICEADQE